MSNIHHWIAGIVCECGRSFSGFNITSDFNQHVKEELAKLPKEDTEAAGVA